MMKAIRMEKFGAPDVLQLVDTEVPDVTSNKVLVKVMAAGVNPVDTYIRNGVYKSLPELPYTPGADAAGIVHLVGANVADFKVGQRVFICGRNLGQHGTYAEYTAIDKEDVFPLDDKLTFEQGAALGAPYFTAHRALIIKAKCVPGETVLIHGASGAVGIAAVQIAKHLNLTAIGTAGTSEGMSLVKRNVADYVFNHREDNYMQKIWEATQGKGVNVVIEMLANVNLENDLDILSPRGKVIVVGCRGTITISPRKTMAPETEIIGMHLHNCTTEEWREIGKAIVKGIRNDWIKPAVDVVYPLDKAFQAHEDVINSKGAKGKLVLSVQHQHKL